MRKQMGLERTRSQKHDLETIQIPMTELRKKYPMAGAREMTSLLFHEKGMSVSRSVQPEVLHSSCLLAASNKFQIGTWLFYTLKLLRKNW
jgi:hypothetical protein